MLKRLLITTMLFAVLTITGCKQYESASAVSEEQISFQYEEDEIEEYESEPSFIKPFVEFTSLDEFLGAFTVACEGNISVNSDFGGYMQEWVDLTTPDSIHLLTNLPESYQITSISVCNDYIAVMYSRLTLVIFSLTYEDLEELGYNSLMDEVLDTSELTEDDFIDGKYIFSDNYKALIWEEDGRLLMLMFPRYIFDRDNPFVSPRPGYSAANLGLPEDFTVHDLIKFTEFVTINLRDETNLAAWSAGDFAMLDDLLTPDPPQSLLLTLDTPTFLHNDIEKKAPAAPFLADGRTMVPLRIIAEALNAVVDWDDATRTVTVTKKGETVTLTINTPLPNGMGTPVIVNGSTFVPIRYISETFGANVHWDGENNTVYIN